MKIAQVNNCDLVGRRFNGHDLQLSLNELGNDAYHFVMEKYGDESTTISLCNNDELFIRTRLRNLELQMSMNNLIYPFVNNLITHPIFQNLDIVHYHLIHNNFFSLFDFPRLMIEKPSVWTIHDPWAVTGHCVYPCECYGWMTGCFNCPKLDDAAFPMQIDKASQMWEIKKGVYQELDVDIIVASRFMEDYIKNSPLTAHFKNIHRIPFGIKVENFQRNEKISSKRNLGIPEGDFVISFRAEKNEIKGLRYILDMLDELTSNIPITLLTLGLESLPQYIVNKYQVIELGWQNSLDTLNDFYGASDVFLMPSLAESFGLMAIEAMASGCPVIVFENTVLSEITFAPECGIAVPYKCSKSLREAVERLLENPEERHRRGQKGIELSNIHYRYDDYVNRHVSLYEDILSREYNKT